MTNIVVSLGIRNTALSLPTKRTLIPPSSTNSDIFIDEFLTISSKLATCRWQHYFLDDAASTGEAFLTTAMGSMDATSSAHDSARIVLIVKLLHSTEIMCVGCDSQMLLDELVGS